MITSELSNEQYHAHAAISSSNCKDLLVSPWLYMENKKNPKAPTPSMEEGTMFHTYVLERELFFDHYYVSKKFNRTTKIGKEGYANAMKNAGNRKVIYEPDIKKIVAMSSGINSNALANALLKNGKAELSCFFKIKDIECKCRADYINVDAGYIVDLKTTASLASEDDFKSTMYRYLYHLSAAFYVDGFSQEYKKPFDFFFIVVEKSAPHNYGIYKIGEDLLQAGREMYLNALDTFATYHKTGFAVPYNDGNLVSLSA